MPKCYTEFLKAFGNEKLILSLQAEQKIGSRLGSAPGL